MCVQGHVLGSAAVLCVCVCVCVYGKKEKGGCGCGGVSRQSCDQTSRKKPHQVHNQDPSLSLSLNLLPDNEQTFMCSVCRGGGHRGDIVVYPPHFFSPLLVVTEKPSDRKRPSCMRSIYLWSRFLSLHLCENRLNTLLKIHIWLVKDGDKTGIITIIIIIKPLDNFCCFLGELQECWAE